MAQNQQFCGKSTWRTLRETTIGSDHYPISTTIRITIEECKNYHIERWNFKNTDWEKFRQISDQGMQKYGY